MKNRNLIRIICAAFICLCLCAFVRAEAAKADEASAVTIGDIDYERLTMKVYKNGNTNIYYSATMVSDLSKWNEVSGMPADDGDGKGPYLLMDLSWTSATAETAFYLRGDVDMSAVHIKLPKSTATFKVSFDKVNGDFTFTGQDTRDYFFYRKSTDYNWIKVYFKSSSQSPAPGDPAEITYDTFLKNVEALRFKGAKLVFKLGQKVGTDIDSMGSRPSKEVTVSISKYSSAPSVKLNILKLTVNTKATMEWTDSLDGTWKQCDKNMTLEELAKEVFLTSGGSSASSKILYFRVAATEKKPCSQIMVMTVPAQKAGPAVGTSSGSEVSYSYENNKLILNFKDASATKPYEYCIVPSGTEFKTSTARWKTVKSAKNVVLTAKAASKATIYVRYKGLNENAKKNIELTLPSAYTSFVANGFTEK